MPEAKPRLPELCADCFMLILQLRAAKEYGDPVTLRKRIGELLRRLERNAKEAGFEHDAIHEKAMFALVAFIDETILGSEWRGKDSWLAQPLQMEWFNRFDAGDEFYNRLQELRQRTAHNAEVVEVFYLCLALGFRGKFQFSLDKLDPFIEDLYNELRRATGRAADLLSPHGKPRDQIVQVVKERVPAWVVGVIAATIGFVFYFIMSISIGGQAGEVKTAIEKMM